LPLAVGLLLGPVILHRRSAPGAVSGCHVAPRPVLCAPSVRCISCPSAPRVVFHGAVVGSHQLRGRCGPVEHGTGRTGYGGDRHAG
jgi:hypothetical protein